MKIFRITPSTPSWKEDLNWVSRIYLEALGEEISHSPFSNKRQVNIEKQEEVLQMLDALLQRPHECSLFIATLHENRIGYFLGLTKYCLAESPSRIGYVSGLYVLPSYRHAGCGQALLEAGNRWFLSEKLELVEIYTALGNSSATSFWKKQGYCVTEQVMMASLL